MRKAALAEAVFLDRKLGLPDAIAATILAAGLLTLSFFLFAGAGHGRAPPTGLLFFGGVALLGLAELVRRGLKSALGANVSVSLAADGIRVTPRGGMARTVLFGDIVALRYGYRRGRSPLNPLSPTSDVVHSVLELTTTSDRIRLISFGTEVVDLFETMGVAEQANPDIQVEMVEGSFVR